MAAWLTYLKERFPLPVYLVLVAGFVLSGQLLYGQALEWLPVVLSFIGLLVFFALLRLMDELKDLDKDRIAHPERPLPRGLITSDEAGTVIVAGIIFMLGWSLATALVANTAAAIAFAAVTAYLWLMYREFYCGAWLEPRPLLYAISHQLIIVPMAAFSVLVAAPGRLADAATIQLSLPLLGAFFAYEVCRKLDPEAHPVLQTYLVVHGRGRTFSIVLVALLVAGAGARLLELGPILWPFEALLLATVTVIWWRPAAYRIPESAAGICLLAHLWAIPLKEMIA